jgi:hypothetical protein
VPIYFVAVALIAWLVGADLNWFLANVFFVKGWGLLWSVAEEARFYVLFPLVILACAAARLAVQSSVLGRYYVVCGGILVPVSYRHAQRSTR